MGFDYTIRVPNGTSAYFHKFIDHRLDNPNAHFIILGFVVMIDGDQILVNDNENLLWYQPVY
jgi:hypothetical protein